MRVPLRSVNLGDFTAAFEPTAAQSSACGFFTRLFQGSACQSAGSPGATLPAPTLPNGGTPSATFGSSPTAPTDYTAVYAGTDANGNPVYQYTLDPDAQQSANVQAITAEAAAALAAANAAAPPPGAPDCTNFFNEYFNPACPSVLPWTSIAIFAAVVAGGLLLLPYLAEGGRRR